MADTLADIAARRQMLQTQLTELNERERELKASIAQRRHAALTDLVTQARALLADPELQIADIEESTTLTENLLIDTLMRPNNHEVAVQVYSAYERNGHVSTSPWADDENRNHRSEQAVVVSFIFPRKDLENALEPLTSLERGEPR